MDPQLGKLKGIYQSEFDVSLRPAHDYATIAFQISK